MEDKCAIRTETDFNFKNNQQCRTIIAHYLAQLNKIIIGKNEVERIISPTTDLYEHIEDSISIYLNFLLGKKEKLYAKFVLMTIEMLLYKIIINKYPPDDLMTNLFKELNKTFNYHSNKYLGEVVAKYLIENNIFKSLITSVNNNFGDIIFNGEQFCIDYFLFLFELNDNLLEKKIKDCEKNIFNFFENKKDIFQIPKECFTSINSISYYLSKIKIEIVSVQKIDNKSKDSQDNQINDKKEIIEEDNNQFRKQDNKEKEEEIRKMGEEMDEIKNCIDSKVFTIQSNDA